MEQAKALNSRLIKKAQRVSGKVAKEAYENETRHYFESITHLPRLFIEVRKVSDPFVYLDLRNLIVLLIYETFHLDEWVELCIVSSSESDKSCQQDKPTLLRLKSSTVFSETTKFSKDDSSCKDLSFSDIFDSSRKHPSVTVVDKKLIICGLGSVIRFVLKFICHKIKNSPEKDNDKTELFTKLKQFLGFRGGCLQACAETSVWTKFCEVEMISAVTQILSIFDTMSSEVDTNLSIVDGLKREVKIPEVLMRFEHHLSLPVRIHNYRKVVQDSRKGKPSEVSEVPSESDQLCTDMKNILITDLKHEFAEGPTLLLSDLILYPSVHASLLLLGRDTFLHLLPITLQWYDKVSLNLCSVMHINVSNFDAETVSKLGIVWTLPEVPKQSLYTRDPKRYKPTLRQFTKQNEIDEAFEFLQSRKITPLKIEEDDPEFKWSDIPVLAHPEGGSLPVSRQKRKCEQLASMAFYALQVYEKKRDQNSSQRFRIVDFCSGGGHLGILLGWLLPQCEIILVENKDESLRRAQERVQGLGLQNIFFYQSNLDYFEGNFDLGLALHACGTATDLVLGKCIGTNASFICCPCCYGAVQENHILNYPRSREFNETKISLRHYFILCHTSDHTHDEAHEKHNQGKYSMALVDTDRCLYARDNCYDVKLCKIVPETASPKNHILVGVSSNSKI